MISCMHFDPFLLHYYYFYYFLYFNFLLWLMIKPIQRFWFYYIYIYIYICVCVQQLEINLALKWLSILIFEVWQSVEWKLRKRRRETQQCFLWDGKLSIPPSLFFFSSINLWLGTQTPSGVMGIKVHSYIPTSMSEILF